MSFALAATADTSAYRDLSVSGVFQEHIAAASRCTSGLGGTIAGYGSSPSMGRVVFLTSDCVTQNGPLFTFSEGRFLITTMTGELLYASYTGQLVPTGDGAKAAMSNATFQITGGTGQYKKATGSGTLSGTEDLSTGQGSIQLTGRILLKD
jgi:hypothetical protein